ncbi:MAG: hypothetical protein U1G08_17260 [Verrucomicrobiota bacterium]
MEWSRLAGRGIDDAADAARVSSVEAGRHTNPGPVTKKPLNNEAIATPLRRNAKRPMTYFSRHRSSSREVIARTAGLIALLCFSASAQSASSRPEDTGYFDGRLWRVGLQANGRSALAVDESGRLCVSGFQLGTTAWIFPSLARWDGRRWETLATNGGPFEVVLPLGNDVYVGGGFSQIDGQKLAGVARFDGTQWHPLGTGIGTRPTAVAALAGLGNQVYVGGQFTVVGSIAATNVAQWNSTTGAWSALGSGLPVGVRALTASEQGVFAGSGGQVYRWTGTDWEGLGPSASDGVVSGNVLALQWHGDFLYAAGNFGPAEGSPATVVLRWKEGRWTRVSDDPITGSAISLSFSGDTLFLAGAFQLPSRPDATAAKIVSLQDGLWTVELNPTSRTPASNLRSRGTELFALAAPTLRWAQNGTDPVIWHRVGNEWAPISGGLDPPPVISAVVPTSKGVLLGGYNQGTGDIPPYPLRYDDAGFRLTSGATNNSGETVVISRKWPGSVSQAFATGWWSGHPESVFIARLDGNRWLPASGPLPVPNLTHLSVSESRLAIAGYSEPLHGEIWEWDGNQWSLLGARFDPSGLSVPAPPTGQNPSRIYSLERHQGRWFAGCAPAQIAGQVLSNLVSWNGTGWENVPGPKAPVHLLRSQGQRLYAGSQLASIPSLLAWEGSTYQDITDRLPLSQLRDLAVSDDGLIAVVGIPAKTISVPLWFRRGEQWVGPSDWDSPELGNGLFGCTWIGNDLYLVGERATLSYAESLGLAIWHEPGPRLVIRPEDPGQLSLRATGAVPARFVWERGDTLGQWSPLQTNALGNPGWIRVAAPDSTAEFFRIRALP